MKKIRLGLAASSVFAFLFLLFSSSPARAEAVLGADVHGAVAVGDTRDAVTSGFGIDGRVGYRLSLVVLALTPEIGGGYLHLSGDNGADVSIKRIFAGARLGFGAIVQPAIFAHVGYGWIDSSTHAPTLDGGIAIDLRLIPRITPGVHASYNVLTSGSDPVATPGAVITTSSSSVQWINLGVHLEIGF